MSKLSVKEKLNFFIGLRDHEKTKKSELEEQLRSANKKINKLESLIDELKPCSKCGGRGEIVCYDGGDSHFETCSRCKGSGEELADN